MADARGPKPPTNPLARLRVAQGLTMQEVADTIGVTRQAVSYWESGQYEPSASNAAAYAKAIGVSTDIVIDALNGERAA